MLINVAFIAAPNTYCSATKQALFLLSGCHSYSDHSRPTLLLTASSYDLPSVYADKNAVSWFYVNDSEAIWFLWDVLLLILNNVWLWKHRVWIIDDTGKNCKCLPSRSLFICIQGDTKLKCHHEQLGGCECSWFLLTLWWHYDHNVLCLFDDLHYLHSRVKKIILEDRPTWFKSAVLQAAGRFGSVMKPSPACVST